MKILKNTKLLMDEREVFGRSKKASFPSPLKEQSAFSTVKEKEMQQI